MKLLGLDPETQKPIEQKEQPDHGEENKTEQEPNTSKGSEENVESKPLDNHGAEEMPKTEGKSEENKANWDDDTAELLNNYEMLCSQLDLESWMTQDTKNITSSYCSSSFSLDDSSNFSVAESPYYLQENSLQQWVGTGSMDSILSWDSINPFEQDLFFMENRQ